MIFTMKNKLCISCKEKPVFIKKRRLCRRCYTNAYNRGQISPSEVGCSQDSRTFKKYQHKGELEFIENYFNHNRWLIHPVRFNLNGLIYVPDFYDAERDVFIEVSRTKQAYHANKEKYDFMRLLFPKLKFEIRKPSGKLLNEDSHDKDW